MCHYIILASNLISLCHQYRHGSIRGQARCAGAWRSLISACFGAQPRHFVPPAPSQLSQGLLCSIINLKAPQFGSPPPPPPYCLGIAESAQILASSTNSKGILKDFHSFLLPFLLTEGIWPAHRQPLLAQISLHSGSKPHRSHSAQGCLLKLLP